jgi:hypothetical protein
VLCRWKSIGDIHRGHIKGFLEATSFVNCTSEDECIVICAVAFPEAILRSRDEVSGVGPCCESSVDQEGEEFEYTALQSYCTVTLWLLSRLVLLFDCSQYSSEPHRRGIIAF